MTIVQGDADEGDGVDGAGDANTTRNLKFVSGIIPRIFKNGSPNEKNISPAPAPQRVVILLGEQQ